MILLYDGYFKNIFEAIRVNMISKSPLGRTIPFRLPLSGMFLLSKSKLNVCCPVGEYVRDET